MKTDSGLPFKTTDAVLAFCLRMAGVPMWVPPMNVYNEEILGRLGYTGRGLTLREAARKADEDKARGRVEFWFEKTPELQPFIEIYHDQERELKAEGNDKDAGARIREIMARASRPEAERPADPGPVMDEREALIRLYCIGLKLNIPFKNQYKEWTSFVEISKGAKDSEQVGPNVTKFYPGLNRVPVNASDSMLRKLKLL